MENLNMTGLDFKIKEMAGRIRALREIEGLEPAQMALKTGVSVRNIPAVRAARQTSTLLLSTAVRWR